MRPGSGVTFRSFEISLQHWPIKCSNSQVCVTFKVKNTPSDNKVDRKHVFCLISEEHWCTWSQTLTRPIFRLRVFPRWACSCGHPYNPARQLPEWASGPVPRSPGSRVHCLLWILQMWAQVHGKDNHVWPIHTICCDTAVDFSLFDLSNITNFLHRKGAWLQGSNTLWPMMRTSKGFCMSKGDVLSEQQRLPFPGRVLITEILSFWTWERWDVKHICT